MVHMSGIFQSPNLWYIYQEYFFLHQSKYVRNVIRKKICQENLKGKACISSDSVANISGIFTNENFLPKKFSIFGEINISGIV